MTSRRITYVITLMSCVLFHAYYIGYFSFFMLVLIIVLPLFSLALSLPSILKLSLDFYAPVKLQRGDEGIVTIKFTGRCWLPVAKLKFKSFIQVSSTHEIESDTHAYYAFTTAFADLDIPTDHCQSLEIFTGKVRASDYLDIFSIPVPEPHSATVIIMPVPIPPVPEPLIPPDNSNAVNLRPKQGGGFAEEHDLREYREGDSVRSIHWKLSSKRDDLIVREPLIPEKQNMVLTIDLSDDLSERDMIFDNLMWISIKLLEHDLPHHIKWVDSADEPQSCFIDSNDKLTQFFSELIPGCGQCALRRSSYGLGSGADWHYHLSPSRLGAAL